MKNLKRIFSVIISLTMVLSLFGAFSVQAAEAEYEFHTQVGATFTPNTDAVKPDVTWTDGSTPVDTSVMGRRVIYGTKDGAAVKGIVNVGVKKWNSYQNNEEKTINNDLIRSVNDEWRYESSSDVNTKLATYCADPKNASNTVVKYNGGRKNDGSGNCNQITYYPATKTGSGNSYSVEFRFMGDILNLKSDYDDTYSIVFRNNDSGVDVYDTFNLKCLDNGLQLILVDKSGKSKQVALDLAPKDEWLNFKYMVYSVTNEESQVSFKSCLYLNGTKIAEIDTSMVNNGTIVPVKWIQIRNSSSSSRLAGTRYAAYLDDMKITDLATTNYIYYDSFDSNYNYEYLQAEGTQAMTINETVKFVDKDSNDSGYSTEVYANATADTSKIGTFKNETAIPGFDEPLTINWTVYKEQLAWEETFENYTETDIGKAPYRAPWLAGTVGKTVEYENAEAETKNTVLKYTSSVAEEDWLKMTDGKSINGKYSIEWSFMLPSLVPNTTFDFKILGDAGAALIEPSVYVRNSGKGELYFTSYTNGANGQSVYIIPGGELKANEWYTVKFTIDSTTDTFTYTYGGVESEKYGVKTIGNKSFYQFRLAQRTNSSKAESTIYVDNVKTSKLLTIKEPVAKNFTVYKGDAAQLPKTATVLLTDGKTTDEAEVTWNGTIDTSTVGTKTITGTVTGTDAQATLNVEVSAYPYEIVSANVTNGTTEVFGLIKGGVLSSVTLNKIANDTKAGRVYAAVYDDTMKLIGANVAAIDTQSAWSKDTNKDIAISLTLPNSNDIDIDTCTLKLFVLSDSLVPFAEVKAQSNDAVTQAATTVWIAGDSLAETKTGTDTEVGWGTAFAALNGNGVTVQNMAIGGRSSKSFYEQGILRDILNQAETGDYLFIQFGHNDSKSEDATRYTTHTEGGTFEQYIAKYVTEARAKGVIPVILTPVVRAKYDTADTFIGDTHAELDDYAAAAKRVAAAYHVPMIDLHALTTAKFKAMNKTEVWKYYDYYTDNTGATVGNADTTHLNSVGAELVAEMIKTEMENIRLPLYKLFN